MPDSGPDTPHLAGAAGTLDRLLEATVVLSFSRAGYAVRGRLRDDRPLPRLDGRTCLVTGANAGLGYATSRGLAALGASVVMVCRSRERGERALGELAADTGGALRLELADLSDLGSVRALARRLLGAGEPLHVLVNNAGVLPSSRSLSPDGNELTLATNVLGPFLLTNELVPLLRGSAPARIVNVTSGGAYTQRLAVDDLQYEQPPFDGSIAYARTKRAQIVLTRLWAERLAGSGVVCNAMHPGWADTPGLASSIPAFRRAMRPLLRTPEQGADTVLWLAAADQAARVSGELFLDRLPRPAHRLARTRESGVERDWLWRECLRLTGAPDVAAA